MWILCTWVEARPAAEAAQQPTTDRKALPDGISWSPKYNCESAAATQTVDERRSSGTMHCQHGFSPELPQPA